MPVQLYSWKLDGWRRSHTPCIMEWCGGSRGLRPTPPPRLAAQSGLEMWNKIEEKTSKIGPRRRPGAPKIMKNVSCEAPWGHLGDPWAPKGLPSGKKTSSWDFLPPFLGVVFWWFFDIFGVFFELFFRGVFGRPLGTILGGFWDDFWVDFLQVF